MPGQDKQLHLLRHAKSSWDDPGLADHDRPLAPRGRRAAARVGRQLRDAGVAPHLILCSSARRAQETLALLELPGEVSIEPELYGTSSRALLERLRRVPDELPQVMLVGHNPEIQSLAIELARESPQRAALCDRFPTGACATLAFAGGWRELGWGRAELTALVRPRDLD